MKKLLALILAAALALSLVACGGGSGAEDSDTPSGGNGDTTSTDTPSGGGEDNAKEEMLANATLLNLSEMSQAFRDNKVRAEETYLGNSFKMFVFAGEIESEYFEYTLDSVTKIRVYLDKEELKELNKNEGVNIVGIIDSVETETERFPDGTPLEQNIFNIKTAYYVDNIVYGVFMVNTFLSDEDKGEACIAESIQMLNAANAGSGYRIFLDEDILSTLNEKDFIFVSGTAYRCTKASAGQYSYTRELRNAELIVKGQDEITEYFKHIDEELN